MPLLSNSRQLRPQLCLFGEEGDVTLDDYTDLEEVLE